MVSANTSTANTSVPSDDMTLLREAAAFHKAGDKEKARALLAEAAAANPQNELVWLWQASLARTAAEAMTAIGKVLDLNPNNEKALGWKVKLESRFPTAFVSANGGVAVAAPAKEAVEEAVEKESATEQAAKEVVEEEAAQEVVGAEVETDEVVEDEAAEEAVAEEAVTEEEETIEEAVEASEEEVVETSEAAVVEEEESEIDWEAQSAAETAEEDDALAALEAATETSEEAEKTTSVADFWSEAETGEEAEEVAEDDNYSATARALEALDQHVDDANVHAAAEDDDPIRRLLAERDGQAYETHDDTEESSWESSYSTEDDEEESADASLLAMFSRDSNAGETAVDSEHEEVEREPETVVEAKPARPVNTHWECPLCGQQSHRVEPTCPTCKSVVDLNRIPDMARNEDVDRVSLKRLISDWEEQADVEPTAALCTKLALGYLNLRQSNSALPHLLQAARMDRGNEQLAAALEQVSRRPLVLVVDDSRTVQRMVLSTLERELFRVQIAEDGLQALAKLNEETPSLILLDITMPRMDGYQVCKVITGNEAFKHIPVVMLSGKDGFFDKVRGRMVGAKDYITKPFEADSLVKSVRKRIETPSK